ncbi:flagellar biosynthetic protein FliR [Thermodesulfatator indicus DSM 15286]|uniref:Flagellar biosynthetic protein FliR n=1 Tax=Thermodesulfatator indicus (strain DSM 15286 / JCM 11887 / CIR29812) TaxID=667014 RepID=F8A9C9_THEID|nr:flagellar biosynthetic protein FliR [Thermodesulfatator indicus]AEH44070.1 flagellar biosynthetic protein FliR [Thermodesulfatator indicus DSM 15286]
MNFFDFYAELAKYAVAFALILVRVGFFVAFLPVFGSRIIPLQIKVALVIALSLVFTPFWAGRVIMPASPWEFGLLALNEAALGICLVFLVRLIFAGVQFGGQLLGFQMGFGVANVLDPATGLQAPVLSQFAYLIALLLFLVLNLHHYFLLSLGESLKLLPPATIKTPVEIFEILVLKGKEIFILGIKIMAPAMAILFLIQIAMGIVARFVPQINILIMSFPLTIAVGLFFFGLTLQIFSVVLAPSWREAVGFLPQIIKTFGK